MTDLRPLPVIELPVYVPEFASNFWVGYPPERMQPFRKKPSDAGLKTGDILSFTWDEKQRKLTRLT